jgi:hypothetical protein
MLPQPTVEDVEDIDSDDNELYDNENKEEYEGDGAGSHTKNSAQVATQQTRLLRQFLAQKTNTKIIEKCQNVLNYMKTQTHTMPATSVAQSILMCPSWKCFIMYCFVQRWRPA